MDMSVRVSSSILFRMCAFYRPPPSSKNKLTYEMFVRDFSSFLESVTISEHPPVLLGDFNIHVDNGRDRDSKTFLDILYSADLFQHVKGSTHRAGHTLDL